MLVEELAAGVEVLPIEVGQFRFLGDHLVGRRLRTSSAFGPPVDEERLYRVIDVLDDLVEETGKAVSQIALNWLIQRPTVSFVIIGARNEAQLRQNLGAIGRALAKNRSHRLEAASAVMPLHPHFPYRIQEGFARRNPPIIG
jgi:aryl-alcohol dehydrogenase-like predicted oxidoreductase